MRLVRAGGGVSIDRGGKRVQGRGAYVCLAGECWQDLRKRRSLEKALKASIPEEFWAAFEQLFTSQRAFPK